jgi:hypothetical protein
MNLKNTYRYEYHRRKRTSSLGKSSLHTPASCSLPRVACALLSQCACAKKIQRKKKTAVRCPRVCIATRWTCKGTRRTESRRVTKTTGRTAKRATRWQIRTPLPPPPLSPPAPAMRSNRGKKRRSSLAAGSRSIVRTDALQRTLDSCNPEAACPFGEGPLANVPLGCGLTST